MFFRPGNRRRYLEHPVPGEGIPPVPGLSILEEHPPPGVSILSIMYSTQVF